jgi:hypothetical protein
MIPGKPACMESGGVPILKEESDGPCSARKARIGSANCLTADRDDDILQMV